MLKLNGSPGVKITWTDLAESDLEKIEQYITQKNSLPVAIGVVLRIINTVELILTDHPFAGRSGRVKDTKELVIDRIPFVVVYRQVVSLNQVQVIRVLHDAQHWPESN